MTPAEFKRKWHRFKGKEATGYVEHFNDLCRMLGQLQRGFAEHSTSKA